jgi:hypothetical protein
MQGSDSQGQKVSAPVSGVEDIRQTVAAFEEFLYVVPDDPSTLDGLCEAYIKLGELERALPHATRLADILIGQGVGADLLRPLMERLKVLGDRFPDAEEKLRELQLIAGPGHQEVEPSSHADVSAELALAWDLFQAGEIVEQEYSMIVQDLTDMATRKLDIPISVLHVLYDRQHKQPERILNYLTRKTGAAFVQLSNFEISQEFASRLPMKYMCQRGAIVFGAIGGEFLVAVLNPMDKAMKDHIVKACGAPCHFYLTAPYELDAVLRNLREEKTGT